MISCRCGRDVGRVHNGSGGAQVTPEHHQCSLHKKLLVVSLNCCDGQIGLDQGIGHVALMSPQNNERLTSILRLKREGDLAILSPDAKQARDEKGGRCGTRNPR